MKWLGQTIAAFKSLVLPERYFSWQTILYLSIFSWLMSLLGRLLGASGFTVGLLASGSWIFLAIGLGWAVEHSQIKPFGLTLAPWVAGGVLCLFLFSSWQGPWLPTALVCWPLISFCVAAVPEVLTWDLQPKRPLPPVRQRLVLLFFFSLLISSWIQFHFRIQSWLKDYPSLGADRFGASNFVYRLPGQPLPLSAGMAHLAEAESFIADQTDGQPWSAVERWLLNREGHQQTIQTQIQSHSQASPESSLWQIQLPQPQSQAEGYELKILAVWTGPTAEPGSYYLEKTCMLMPVLKPASDAESALPTPSRWAKFTCEPEIPSRPGPPPLS
ncbi:MAG: DUF5357 domain-containing protein [Cyanobacteria bacterium REEB459]|nr:DUF5357 domain-containing protein [Cyanobacteria bacterium REEB459]